MNKKKAAKQGTSHSAYASQVVALSNIYSATPWKGVRKTYHKGTPDRVFKQTKTISGNGEKCVQICTLTFKSTAHPGKHERVKSPAQGALKDGRGPDLAS